MERHKYISLGRQSFFHYGHRCPVHDSGRTVNADQSSSQQGMKLLVHGGWGEVSTYTPVPLETCQPKTYTNRHRHCQHYLYNHPYHPYQGNCQQTEKEILPKPLWKNENLDSYLDASWRYRDSVQNKDAMSESASHDPGDKHMVYLKERYDPYTSFVPIQPTERRKRCHSETDLDNVDSNSRHCSTVFASEGAQQIYSFDDCHLSSFNSQDTEHETIADSLEVLCIEALNLSDADSSGSDADVSRSASTIPICSVSDLRQDFDDTEFGPTLDDIRPNTDFRFNNSHHQQTRVNDDPYSLEGLFRSL